MVRVSPPGSLGRISAINLKELLNLGKMTEIPIASSSLDQNLHCHDDIRTFVVVLGKGFPPEAAGFGLLEPDFGPARRLESEADCSGRC